MPAPTPYDGSTKPFTVGLKPLDLDNWIEIDHTFDARALTTVGRDAEALALSRAVRWHCENRILLNGRSTVVFR